MRYINVDSKDRTNGTEFNFAYQVAPSVRANKLKIKTIEIPVAWYNIRANIDKFSFKLYNSVNTLLNTYTLSIANGNYSVSLFTSYLQTIFNNSVTGTTATITTDSSTAKINISLTNSYQLEIVETQLSKILGFTAGQKSNSLTATNSYNMNHDLYVNVVISNVVSNYNSNISYKIPVSVNQSKILYLDLELFNQELEINDGIISGLNIQIYDRYGNVISNNGVDWSLTLCLD